MYKLILVLVLFVGIFTVQGELIGSLCNKTAQCGEECGKIIYCERDRIPNEGVDCPASHPFCINGPVSDYCSTKPDPTRQACAANVTQINEFYCTSEGYFPDPTNCRRYYICANNTNGELYSTSYSCPIHHIFNFNRNKECYRYQNAPVSLCPNITCTTTSSTYAITHPRDTQYFYFCIPDPRTSVIKPMMFKCPDGWIFNGKKCVFNCQREGRYAVPGNDTMYYECTYIANRYVLNNKESCPQGYKFSSSIQYCQVQNMI